MTELFIPGAGFVKEWQGFSLGSGVSRTQYPPDWVTKATAEDLAAIGATTKPTCDPACQVLERDVTAGWVVRDKTADEMAAGLAAARGAAASAIDQQAEESRARHLTQGHGQALTYAEKEKEARDLLGGGAGPWPLLSAESQATGAVPVELAAAVLAAAERWRGVAAQIEGRRRGAKVAVERAGSIQDVAAVLAALCWPD